MKNWPHDLLLARGDATALSLLDARYQRQPQKLLQYLGQRRLTAIAIRRFAKADLGDAALLRALEPFLGRSQAWAAQLELAVRECAAFATKHDCEFLLIKGAANARSLYSHQVDRLGNDVDVVMHPGDVERIWPGAIAEAQAHGRAIDHLDRTPIAGLPLEIHYRWGEDGWGTAADLFADSANCPDLPGLRLPAPLVAMTLTLTHAYKHRGVMPFDWLDLHLQCQTDVDWQAASEFWRERGLTGLVLPGLLVARELALPIPASCLKQLQEDATPKEREVAAAMRDLIFARQWRRLRAERVEALIASQSLVARCAPQLAGSPAVTERLTGLRPGMPGYSLQHYLVQPARRIYRNLRG